MQSTVYLYGGVTPLWPHLANDGDRAQDLTARPVCALTSGGVAAGWWAVNLDSVYMVNTVSIYNRHDENAITCKQNKYNL